MTPDRAHAHVRDLHVGVLEAARVLALVDVVERGLHGVDPGARRSRPVPTSMRSS